MDKKNLDEFGKYNYIWLIWSLFTGSFLFLSVIEFGQLNSVFGFNFLLILSFVIIIHELSHMVMSILVIDGGKIYFDLINLKAGKLNAKRTVKQAYMVLLAPLLGVPFALTVLLLANIISTDLFIISTILHIVLINADVQGILEVYNISQQFEIVEFAVSKNDDRYIEWVYIYE